MSLGLRRGLGGWGGALPQAAGPCSLKHSYSLALGGAGGGGGGMCVGSGIPNAPNAPNAGLQRRRFQIRVHKVEGPCFGLKLEPNGHIRHERIFITILNLNPLNSTS